MKFRATSALIEYTINSFANEAPPAMPFTPFLLSRPSYLGMRYTNRLRQANANNAAEIANGIIIPGILNAQALVSFICKLGKSLEMTE
jgi:hypothetical protein